MSTIDESGPAFPLDSNQYGAVLGMSLRDYFAAKAMASLTTVYWEDFEQYGSGAALIKCQIETAYEMADAMLAERAK